MTLMTRAQQIKVHQDCKTFLAKNGFVRGANVWVWPGGARNQEADDLAADFWPVRRAVGVTTGMTFPGLGDETSGAHYYVGETFSAFKVLMDRAAADGATIIFVLHGVHEDPVAENMSPARLAEYAQYAREVGLEDRRFSDIFF